MLSDEEREAIESLKNIAIYIGDNYTFSQQGIRNLRENLRIVLPVIDEQSKEIEELKMQLEIEKIDNKYNKEEATEEMIPRYKIKAKIEEEDKLFFKTKDVRHANRYKAYKELLEKE